MAGDDHVAQSLDRKRSRKRALDDHVAPVGLVASAGEKAKPAHRVEGTGDRRLGDAEFLGKTAYGVRRRFEIDGQKHGDLPLGKVGVVVMDEVEGHVVPQAQSLAWTQLDGHVRLPAPCAFVSEPNYLSGSGAQHQAWAYLFR